MKVSFFK